jgi:hypothetical protein
MAEPVNLNKFRKRQARDAEKKQAAENRVAFGRSKSEREILERLDDKARRDLDDKKLD